MENKIITTIECEMKKAYLDYSMSVIVGRAIPDVRDGLKPVHRRILYAMYNMGLGHNKPFKKSATIIGEVLGKYHPHGDASVYEALARMAQDFTMRYPLISGHGNFGSIDGDPPAAYRYTEARLAEIAEYLLKDIEKETVEFRPNFDGTQKEPVVLPTMVPNLIINGATGIAVGVSTSIPPHNIGEVADAIIAMIDNNDVDIFNYINGPDLPTGGEIEDIEAIKEAYTKGTGRITIRGKAHIVKRKNKSYIYINEIPYLQNKSSIVAEIAEKAREKKIEGIADVRDESDKEGIRIVIELKPQSNEEIVLKKLFTMTNLTTTFTINFLVLDNGVPKTLSLKEILEKFISHRYNVVKRRCEYELSKSEDRAHILDGIKIALNNIDEVIKIIKEAKEEINAKNTLMKKFNLTERQANAILNITLGKLVKMEIEKIENDYIETIKEIEKLKITLANPLSIMEIIKQEIKEIKEKFNSPRKTNIIEKQKEVKLEELIPDEKCVVIITKNGFAKRIKYEAIPVDKQTNIITLLSGDEASDIFVNTTHSITFIITEDGKCYHNKTYEIPEMEKKEKGKTIPNISIFSPITATISVKKEMLDNISQEIGIITEKGMIKRMKLKEMAYTRQGKRICKIKKNDKVVATTLLFDDVFIFTKNGKVIRFNKEEIPITETNAKGVIGIKLKKDDKVIAISSMKIQQKQTSLFKQEEKENKYLIIATGDGFIKKLNINIIPKIKRGGVGIFCGKSIAAATICEENDKIIIITKNGIAKKIGAQNINETTRMAKGKKIINIQKNDEIKKLTI